MERENIKKHYISLQAKETGAWSYDKHNNLNLSVEFDNVDFEDFEDFEKSLNEQIVDIKSSSFSTI